MLEVELYIHDDSIEYTFQGSDFISYSEGSLDRWRQIVLKNQSYYEGVILMKLDGMPIFGFDCFDIFNDMVSYFQTTCRHLIEGSSNEEFYLPSQPYSVEVKCIDDNYLDLIFDKQKKHRIQKYEFLQKVLEQCRLFHQIEYNILRSEYALRDLQEAERLLCNIQ